MNLTVKQIAVKLNVSRQKVTAKIKRTGIKSVGITEQRVPSSSGVMILKSKLYNWSDFHE